MYKQKKQKGGKKRNTNWSTGIATCEKQHFSGICNNKWKNDDDVDDDDVVDDDDDDDDCHDDFLMITFSYQ